MSAAAAPAGKLLTADLVRLGSTGLRTRRLRAVLSALGIAIGIASMVSVLGIAASSREDLVDRLDRLGTNLLAVSPGQSLGGDTAVLPEEAGRMAGRIHGVDGVASLRGLDASVRRTNFIPEEETGGIAVAAADPSLLAVLGGEMAYGRFLDRATGRYPAVALGSVAAERLGVERPGVSVYLDDRWFTVIGILKKLELAPDLDRSAFIGFGQAADRMGEDRDATTIYVRADPDEIDGVSEKLAATANPEAAEEVEVSRPSDALEARIAAKGAFTGLFLGLGAVALLVGGVGIANTMIVNVLERRSEIGLRRALGATRTNIRSQFLAEALILATLGGIAGVVLGSLVTAGAAIAQGWQVVVPVAAGLGGIVAALAIGGIAGLYPAMRAARMSPTEALRTT